MFCRLRQILRCRGGDVMLIVGIIIIDCRSGVGELRDQQVRPACRKQRMEVIQQSSSILPIFCISRRLRLHWLFSSAICTLSKLGPLRAQLRPQNHREISPKPSNLQQPTHDRVQLKFNLNVVDALTQCRSSLANPHHHTVRAIFRLAVAWACR